MEFNLLKGSFNRLTDESDAVTVPDGLHLSDELIHIIENQFLPASFESNIEIYMNGTFYTSLRDFLKNQINF